MFVTASGSNIGLLTSFPVGKVEQHNLQPLTFQEFLWASGEAPLIKAFEKQLGSTAAHKQLLNKLTDYYFTGGMPEIVSRWFASSEESVISKTEAVSELHENLVNGYLRNFGKYSGKTNTQLIESVFSSIPAQLSALGIDPSFSWNDARSEIEFLLSDSVGNVIPVEVKSGRRTKARSLQSYINKCQPEKTIKLTGTQGSSVTEKKHFVLPLYYTQHMINLLK